MSERLMPILSAVARRAQVRRRQRSAASLRTGCPSDSSRRMLEET